MATAAERNPIRNRGLKLIPYENHDEWLKIRRGHLGGTDAGAIIGLNLYSSPFSVWAEKTEQVPEFEGNVSTKVGTYLEDLVAKMFAEETGKKIQRFNFTIVNHDLPWACANIDREIIGEDALLEIKTTSSWDVSKMTRNGQYPDQWYCQMSHYLAVTGCKKAYLAVLVECKEFKIFELERNEDELRALMSAEKDFWDNYIVPRKMPPVDGHSATTEAIRKIFPQEMLPEADLSDCYDLFSSRKTLTESKKKIQAEIDAIENDIKVRMGLAATGKCGAFSVSWKTQRSSALDRDAIKADYPDIDFTKYTKESRVFRINEKKGAK